MVFHNDLLSCVVRGDDNEQLGDRAPKSQSNSTLYLSLIFYHTAILLDGSVYFLLGFWWSMLWNSERLELSSGAEMKWAWLTGYSPRV